MNDEFVVKEEIVKGFTVKVIQDTDCPESPREWDNLGTMVCWHRRYDLGDKHNFSDNEDFQEWLKENKCVVLPLFLYDHSGITMNTGGFSCQWDSGQVGWIYVTEENIKKEYSVKRISKKLRERVREYLRAEVKTYDQFLTGEVYGYVVEETNDSCWGFYDIEDCFNEGKSMAEYHYKKKIKQHCKQVKTWILNKVPLDKRTSLQV